MKESDSIQMEFPSTSSNESFARAAAAAFTARLDPTMEELGDVKTAVSEAVTNAIVHAYPDRIGKVMLRLRILEGQTLEITVRDWGCGMQNVEQAMQPLYTTGGEERSGMGFTVMETFCDSVRVRSKPGVGTTVVLQKRIKSRR